MDLNLISQLIKMTEQSKLTALEIEQGDLRVKLEKASYTNKKQISDEIKEDYYISQVQKDDLNIYEEKKEEEDKDCFIIKSPIVGTFYGAPSVDKEPYVTIGKKVKIGEILCIVEAMKLMNEIESEYEGEVVEMLVKDGQMVEYGQPLFKIR